MRRREVIADAYVRFWHITSIPGLLDMAAIEG